jgi:hypothetical protein
LVAASAVVVAVILNAAIGVPQILLAIGTDFGDRSVAVQHREVVRREDCSDQLTAVFVDSLLQELERAVDLPATADNTIATK